MTSIDRETTPNGDLTNGATDWEHFTINNDHYLAVANAFSFGRHNPAGVDSYRTNSTIYVLDKRTFNFVQYQTLVTNSAVDWEYLNIGDEHYLFVTNAQYGGLGDRLMSNVYRWQGLDKFVLVHKLMTPPNTTDFELFRDRSDIFLVLARADKHQSEVMKVKFV
ncbi:thrombospondin-type laminin G domain and EAR repeat-containing protein-like [Elysia marginata]|uniref:Thrombospondin-type laminin G domain and EAR repeat-containing protein-like n=1 Tax=Elysia marginata TaxID=1093978 RepID=A0AAV4FCP9_9GAST|nr:thrombospondin-type laminin G domain and EAR repeat-containing protein-like [Elysia marginata]